MKTSTVEYLGELRTRCTHVRSGETILTDAPVDNKGRGEYFSPTDLVATAYASCMLSIIGIYCNEHDLPYTNGRAEIVKSMASGPRRISKLEIELHLEGNGWSGEIQRRIVAVAEACPVARSVSADIELDFTFHF